MREDSEEDTLFYQGGLGSIQGDAEDPLGSEPPSAETPLMLGSSFGAHRPSYDPEREWEFAGWGTKTIVDLDIDRPYRGTEAAPDEWEPDVSARSPLLMGQGGEEDEDDYLQGASQRELGSLGGSPTPDGHNSLHPRRSGKEEKKRGCCGQANTAKKVQEEHKLLGQIPATAIAGNDITSSCLYVAGLCALVAGKFAPVSLFLVVVVLYLFRNVYAEIGEALPLNGGAYNALLNTTTKLVSAVAACLTLLSYVATAVVSAYTAMSYLHSIWAGCNVFWATIAVLGLFALLNLVGISESAGVASVIFGLHLVTLATLIVCCCIKVFPDWTLFLQNWRDELPPNPDYPRYEWPKAIYYGFASGLLGVSGFESSANFIEEQKPGVFPKTLRNMWAIVAFCNPAIALLSLGVLPVSEIQHYNDTLLSRMGEVTQGDWLKTMVSVDATLVLSGAVLTSYVGVTGLVRRMSLDRCLPQFLLSENPLTKTNHFIIIGFFLITSSLLAIVDGNVQALAGVYSIAFLCVMALFALGNMFLKFKRSKLPRRIKASWPGAVIAFIAVIAGMVGNIIIKPVIVKYFVIYFAATLAVVMLMFARVRLLRILFYFLSKSFLKKYLKEWIQEQVHEINSQRLIVFTKKGDLAIMNKCILYCRENELTARIVIVNVSKDRDEAEISKMEKNVAILDTMYPKQRIDLVLVRGEFNPATVKAISERLDVPPNFMFLTCPGDEFPNLGEFNGVRLITH